MRQTDALLTTLRPSAQKLEHPSVRPWSAQFGDASPTCLPSRAAGFGVRTLVGTNAERTRQRAELCGLTRHTTELAEALADP